MKRALLVIILLLGFIFQGLAQVNSSHVRVKGYTRKNGTYVAPHYRTAPNSTNRDNFSTRGNSNPYTGRSGYVPRDNKPKYIRTTTSSNSRTKISSSSNPSARTSSSSSSSSSPPASKRTNSVSTTKERVNYYQKPTEELKEKIEPAAYKSYPKTKEIYDFVIQPKWIKKRLNKLTKSSLRKDKNYSLKTKAQSTRQERLLSRNKNIRIYQLSNGWYDVNFATTIEVRKKMKNVFIKRQILIQNGKATKYIGAENMIFDINEFFQNKDHYKMKIVYPDNEVSKVYGDIYLYESEPLKRIPSYQSSNVLYFYTKNNNHGGPISVTLENNIKTYWGGYLNNYWTSAPNCNANEDVVKFYVPNGDYQYYAENNNGFWKKDITINSSCIGIKLGSN